MDAKTLEQKFAKMGARAEVIPQERGRGIRSIILDIRRDRMGEFFLVRPAAEVDVQVLDVQPRNRHLLLMVRDGVPQNDGKYQNDKYLCGHDERHWFVAAVPEKAPVGSVVTAMEALKPAEIRRLEQGLPGKRDKKLRRRTETFVRQGEWFFVPAPRLEVVQNRVLHNEPISRGRGGKPHLCEYLYRSNGESVYVCSRHPQGITAKQYGELLQQNPEASRWNWRVMLRNATVHVRGRVRHADHATIMLRDWHRVLMNTENESRSLANVAFLD